MPVLAVCDDVSGEKLNSYNPERAYTYKQLETDLMFQIF